MVYIDITQPHDFLDAGLPSFPCTHIQCMIQCLLNVCDCLPLRQTSRCYTDSSEETKSAENTLTKPHKIKRRFTFTRSKSPSKTATQRSSEAVTPTHDFSAVRFRHRKASTPTSKAVTLLSKRDSSEESFNWSIPSDLPGLVDGRMGDRGSMENMFSDADEIRARCRSTPTIAERRESDLSIESSEMRVSHSGVTVSDVGVQVNTCEPIFQFPDILPGTLNHYSDPPSNRSPPQTRSVPQSPYNTRGINNAHRTVVGGQGTVSWGKGSIGNGDLMTRVHEQRIGRTGHRIPGQSPKLYSAHNTNHFTDIPRKENVSMTSQRWNYATYIPAVIKL